MPIFAPTYTQFSPEFGTIVNKLEFQNRMKIDADFKLYFLSLFGTKNIDFPCPKLIKKSSDDTSFGRNLFFDTISPVQSEEIFISALGADILKFETSLAPNFEFALSWARTKGGRMLRRR